MVTHVSRAPHSTGHVEMNHHTVTGGVGGAARMPHFHPKARLGKPTWAAHRVPHGLIPGLSIPWTAGHSVGPTGSHGVVKRGAVAERSFKKKDHM